MSKKKPQKLKAIPASAEEAATEKPVGPGQIQRAQVRNTFTIEELSRLGGELSQALARIEELQEQKKNATAEFTNKINVHSAMASSFGSKIRSGYEMVERDVRCEFFPKRGVKKLYDPETGEFIREELMDCSDLQIGLPIDDVDPAEPEE